MERDKKQRKRNVRVTTNDEVVDLSNSTGRLSSNDSVELEAISLEGASTSVAIVDLTKESNEQSGIVIPGDIVDLTDISGAGEEDVTPPKRARKLSRRRPSHQMGSGNSVVISSGDETDESDDLVLLSSPSPEETAVRLSLTSPSPRKAIKCPICYDDYITIKQNNRRLMSTTCGHVFCEDCIRQSVRAQRKCPTCRKKLTASKIHPLYL